MIMTALIQSIRLLSDFYAGLMLLLLQPFKVGDLIEVAETFGTVEEIQLLKTIIITLDNKSITVPNTQLSEKMSNYSTKGILRLELLFGLANDDDLLKALHIFKEIMSNDQRVLNKPAPTIALVEAADSQVKLALRPYVKVEDYWDLRFDLRKCIKQRFLEEGIAIADSRQKRKGCLDEESAAPDANDNRKRHRLRNMLIGRASC